MPAHNLSVAYKQPGACASGVALLFDVGVRFGQVWFK